MTKAVKNYNTPKYRRLAWIFSVVIFAAVAALFPLPKLQVSAGMKEVIGYFPAFNAAINGTTFFILIAALIAIKRKNIKLHKQLIFGAMILSATFLITYVGYHITFEHTVFPKDNPNRTLYLIILNSHIVLSAVIVPMVLFSFIRGISMHVESHRKLARITLPIWLYVTLTGVLVYMMISPFYRSDVALSGLSLFL